MKKLLFLVLVLIVALVVFRNAIVKNVVVVGGTHVTGARVKIKDLNIGLVKPRVKIEGFQVYNPKGFPKEVMVDVNEVIVEYDLPAVLTGKLHLPMVVFDLEEFVMVKNAQGDLNIDSLKFAQEAKEKEEGKTEGKKPAKGSKEMAMQIDEFHLNIGRVVVKDYTQGQEPMVQAYDVGLQDKVFKDIKSAQQLATLITMEAMGPTALKSAALYGAATMLGVALLPVGAAAVLMADDDSVVQLPQSIDTVFGASLEVLNRMGQVTRQDKSQGAIKAKVDGADVTVEVSKGEGSQTELKASARKFLLPKPDVAGGVIYEIQESLK